MIENKETLKKVIEWMGTGEVGCSSTCIAVYLTTGKVSKYPTTPSDPDDLLRCVKLLELVPELKTEFYKMGELDIKWKRLTDNWKELIALFESEGKNHYNSPKTYKYMKCLGL